MGAAVTLQWIYTLRYEMLRCLLACLDANMRICYKQAYKAAGFKLKRTTGGPSQMQ